ncbi:TPA: hypothetical protein RTK63_005068 [Vibrio harveyi]|nr:hypothetical protein [Vibrio harveyi]
MRPKYKLIIMASMLSTHAFATIPMSVPTYVLLQNLVESQKQEHQRCIDNAEIEPEKSLVDEEVLASLNDSQYDEDDDE